MGRSLCFWRPPLRTQLVAEISNAPQSPDQGVSVWTCWLWHLCGCACKKLNRCCKRSWGQTVEVDEEKDRAEVLWAGTWHLSLPPSQVASMIPWCWHQPVLPPLLTGGSFHLSAHTTLALISQFPRQVWGFAWNCCIPKCVSSFLMWFRVVCCLCQQEKKGLTTLTYLLRTQSALRKLQRGALLIRPDQSRVRRALLQMWTWAFHD